MGIFKYGLYIPGHNKYTFISQNGLLECSCLGKCPGLGSEATGRTWCHSSLCSIWDFLRNS